ncbi:Oidioi.mRNA.OKI2018_I69.chr2.g4573.t1.cds [Oikopleura dioica]|uniref:Oidioi.mRNA.OKI2018_I69.chr2.g4573.t1.cds n=1 Tax=Oikopleura dioica TaxID=34765 RepID=A0ABN7T163_OIKDI|nr:Oidioi.mRNA.OKI2018_I69.chr2.g4573.t1.cds [Oikopleura dioica]
MKADYSTAHKHCRNQGGYLAFFLDQKEFDDYKLNNNQEYIGYWSCDHPNFMTADGNEAEFTNWGWGEPNNDNGNEVCISLLPNGKMSSVPCDREYEFSCRLPQLCLSQDNCEEYFCRYGNICYHNDDVSTSEKPKCPTSYSGQNCECGPIFVPQTDEFGKFIEADYATANKICRRQGGFLAFLLNQKEHDDYTSSVWFPKSDTSDAFAYGTEYLGYHSCGLPTFYTDDGNEATWINEIWAQGEPNNRDGIEYCVAMTYWKEFNDYYCDKSLPFACRFSKNCQ